MTALEKLAEAITRLEEIKQVGWPCREWSYSAARHIARNCEIECEHTETEDEHGGWSRYETGYAIHTLSQTIDSQIAVLRAALGEYDEVMSEAEKPYWAAALRLADAILGGAS